MNHCVPRSKSKDQANIINLPFSMPGFSERDVRMNEEVKELTWRNGKPQLGTLESIIEQAKAGLAGAVAQQPSFVSWLTGEDAGEMNLGSREGSCSGDGERERKKACLWSSPEDTWEVCGGLSSSLSPENISSGDGFDSFCRSNSSSQGVEEIEKKKKKSKKVMRRSKAATIHNQSERKRRDMINEKMQALQKLVPNSRKTDKASILDEVINYLKQLQNQVKMMTCISHMMMMMPNLQMSMMAQAAQMTQMGLGLNFMDFGSFVRPGTVPIPLPPLHHPLSFPPFTIAGERMLQASSCSLSSNFFSAFMQQQRMNMEAYKKMATMYEQLNQQQNKANSEN